MKAKNNFTQMRKAPEAQIKQGVILCGLCALVRRLTDEIVYFFTAPCAMGYDLSLVG